MQINTFRNESITGRRLQLEGGHFLASISVHHLKKIGMHFKFWFSLFRCEKGCRWHRLPTVLTFHMYVSQLLYMQWRRNICSHHTAWQPVCHFFRSGSTSCVMFGILQGLPALSRMSVPAPWDLCLPAWVPLLSCSSALQQGPSCSGSVSALAAAFCNSICWWYSCNSSIACITEGAYGEASRGVQPCSHSLLYNLYLFKQREWNVGKGKIDASTTQRLCL